MTNWEAIRPLDGITGGPACSRAAASAGAFAAGSSRTADPFAGRWRAPHPASSTRKCSPLSGVAAATKFLAYSRERRYPGLSFHLQAPAMPTHTALPSTTPAEDPSRVARGLPFSYAPLVADFLLRFVVWRTWRDGNLGATLFWTLQIVVIPLFGLLRVVKTSNDVERKLGAGAIENKPRPIPVTITLLAYVAGLWLCYSSVPGIEAMKLFWTIACAIALSFYLVIIYLTSVRVPALSSASLPARFDRPGELPDADSNDIAIVGMETEVLSISQRVESFTIESALLGALAFSAFVTLITANPRVLDSTHALFEVVSRTPPGQWAAAATWQQFPRTELILAAIAVETIICSMFFLTVIVARIRFYDALREVEYSVRSARAWNDKEEEVFGSIMANPAAQLEQRLARLTTGVRHSIDHALPLVADLRRSSMYMWSFRNLGILSFVLILVTSAWLLSSTLAFGFVFFWAAVSGYSSAEQLIRHRRLGRLRFFQQFHALLRPRARPAVE